MSELRFNGNSGRRPQAEARRYVYGVLATMLEHELTPEARDGWIFGGIEHDADRLRLKRAVRDVVAVLRKRVQ